MIEHYEFGKIKVNGKEYASDLIITKDAVDASWWRKEGHSVCLEDLKSVFEDQPEVLIIGTGADGLMNVPQNIQDKIKALGINLIIRKSKEACDEYNKFFKTKKTIAALHLTC